MSDIKVTQAEIDLLLNSADVQVRTEFGKCTVVTVRLRNGFILTESSACVRHTGGQLPCDRGAVGDLHQRKMRRRPGGGGLHRAGGCGGAAGAAEDRTHCHRTRQERQLGRPCGLCGLRRFRFVLQSVPSLPAFWWSPQTVCRSPYPSASCPCSACSSVPVPACMPRCFHQGSPPSR